MRTPNHYTTNTVYDKRDSVQERIQDFKLGGSALKIVGVFRVKNHDFTPKNHIFSNFRGAHRGRDAPPGSAPGVICTMFLVQQVIIL
jgi:hypothetical protein